MNNQSVMDMHRHVNKCRPVLDDRDEMLSHELDIDERIEEVVNREVNELVMWADDVLGKDQGDEVLVNFIIALNSKLTERKNSK